jgi:hypothetical protein
MQQTEEGKAVVFFNCFTPSCKPKEHKFQNNLLPYRLSSIIPQPKLYRTEREKKRLKSVWNRLLDLA